MKEKLILFHPAIAPYRIDFFNSLNACFDATFYFEFGDALEQSFEQERLIAGLTFSPRYLRRGFLGIKNLRLQALSILRRERPAMVFCSEFNLTGILLLAYKLLYDRKLRIFTICDDSRDIAASYSLPKKLLRAFLTRFYTGVILPSTDTVDWYATRYPALTRKFLFFPIIQKEDPFREKLEASLPKARELFEESRLKGKRTILFVGRLIDIKNLSFLLACFATNAATYPDAVLLLVGEGDKEDELRDLAKRLCIAEKVLFAGKKQGEALYAYYNLGQIFVLPSYLERFGAVVNEALLAGCYTLCSEAAGASCLIHEKNGAIFNPFDKTDLTGKLEKALANTPPLERVDDKPCRMGKSYERYFNELLSDLR